MKTRLLVIDGNMLVYQSHYAKGTCNLLTSRNEPSGAFFGALRSFLSLTTRFHRAHLCIAFDGGHSGRNELYEPYKATRVYKSVVHNQVLDVLQFLRGVGVPVLYREGLEADDLIAIAAHAWIERDAQYQSLIVSSDQDYFQLVTDRILVYDNRAKVAYGSEEVFAKTGVKVQDFLWYKCFKGDRGDNIPRIPGYTEKVAKEACVGGPLPRSHFHFEQYRMNRNLMRLPRAFRDMRCLTSAEAKQYTRDLENQLIALEQGERSLSIGVSSQLLARYEVSSFRVEDFIPCV